MLSRALQRVLVMPMFTDVEPTVDVSKYVSLECLRRNSQAVTFEEFREQVCHGAGLETPPPDGAVGIAQPDGGSVHTNDGLRGTFCGDDALLQLETSFSLADYRGYNCWDRREDLTNARDLGIQVSGCTHVPPRVNIDGGGHKTEPYTLADIRRHFAGRSEKLLLFLDLFGVNLMPSAADLADTISAPDQMCSWMPTEAAAAAADTVMQILIPQLSQPAVLGAADGGASNAAATLGLSAVLDPTTHRTLFMGPSELTRDPPPVRLRGARRYAAVHLRRSDWFYYCGGAGHCFYSIAEAAVWLNESLAAQGLDTLYVSTNADAREKAMLRRTVAGRVLYWEDALMQLRSWQAEGAVAEGAAAEGAAAEGATPPAWLMTLPLDDELMVQMVEKAICMQAAFFVSSIGSTFSNQIRAFRNGGLEDLEWVVIENKFPGAVASAHPESATTSNSGAPPAAAAAKVVPLLEQPTYLCDRRHPLYADERRLPDCHNPKVFLEEMTVVLKPLGSAFSRLWQRLKRKGANPAAPAPSPATVVSLPPPTPTPASRSSIWQILRSPFRTLEWLTLVAMDGHAMAAANRFVDMYTSGAMVGLVVEGTLTAPPAALADCVVAAAAEAGAVSVHVALVGLPENQQVLLMQELEARAALGQITRMGGPDQERESTFTLMWRGEGLSRHAEPALLEELPTFLERVDAYVLAKSRVLLGDRRGVLFRQVESTRRVFGFDDPRDGKCAPAELRTGGP